MNKTKRQRYAAELKAKIAIEAIRGELTISELAAKHSIHPNLITQWKRHAIEGLADVFSGKAGEKDTNHEVQIKELHAKIGQLTVERDFLAKAFGR